jgi:hypothetical protein
VMEADAGPRGDIRQPETWIRGWRRNSDQRNRP